MTEIELLQYDIYLASLTADEQYDILSEAIERQKLKQNSKKSLRQIRYEIVKEILENMLQ